MPDDASERKKEFERMGEELRRLADRVAQIERNLRSNFEQIARITEEVACEQSD